MKKANPMHNVDYVFQVIPLTNTHNGIVIHSSIDPRTRGRNVTGLMPCSTYNFEVFTINEGQRSENSERTEVLTSKDILQCFYLKDALYHMYKK